MIKELNIKHGRGTTPVLIGAGLLEGLGPDLSARLGCRTAAIISDTTVAGLYLERVETSMKDSGIETVSIIIPDGEASKSFAMLEEVCSKILSAGIERGDAIVALGGGVVGDLAGLAASLVRRGVNLVIAPTTVLAQVDSSIGGKTAINTPIGKNLVGTFYPPKLVVSDISTLTTLPEREIRAGYAEIVKHAIISGDEHFTVLEGSVERFISGDQETRQDVISKSIRVKAAIVEADEKEDGPRMTLNLGHTFGHALEGIAAYDGTLLHGEAVALGLMLAFRYAASRGQDVAGDLKRVAGLLEKAGLKTNIKDCGVDITPNAMLGFMTQDKKNIGGAIRLIVPRSIGDVGIEETNAADLDQFLQTVNK